MTNRRRLLRLAAGMVALPAVSRIARAQAYPTRPVTLVVSYPAGSAMDAAGRIVAERMRASLGQPVIIENISGANGSIGVGRVAHAAGDGYTLVIGTLDTHVANGAIYPLTYDLLADFEPISLLLNASFLIVARKAMPANDLQGLIAWLKANRTRRRKGRQESEAHSMSAAYYSKNSPALAFSSYPIAVPARRCRI
jgi:tripartite-type tricarboxylate transporter receptor subunit TctC